jgi:hypothetical protein
VKVSSLVAGMVARADPIDDLALLRHRGMGKVFSRIYAPSTLGSFLRAFRFGAGAVAGLVDRPAPSEGGVDARFQLFDAVVGGLAAASRSRPLLLVVDDLHWADESTIRLLQVWLATPPTAAGDRRHLPRHRS